MAKIKLPYDINAESGVVCTLINQPEFIVHSENLKPSYFFDKKNGCIYWAIDELYKKGIDKIDYFNLITQINSNSGTKRLMGDISETKIQEIVELSIHLKRDGMEEYKNIANRIVALAFKRDLYKKIKAFETLCLDDNDDISNLNTVIYDDINNMAQKYICNDDIVLYKDVLDDIWQRIIDRRNPDGTFGIPSKFQILNKYFTYQPGELILWTARRKMGKSVIALNELVHKLKNDIPVAYFDTEMNDDLFTTRLLSHLTSVPESRIKSGSYSGSEEQMIEDAKQWIKTKAPLFTHIYDPCWNRDKIYTRARILKYKTNFQFFIYDYIKLTDDKTTSSSEQYNELGIWADFLKNKIGGSLDVPVMSMAQLNRSEKIADSDKIERYVTTGLIWRKKTPEEIEMDGEKCGNYAVTIDFNRIGDDMDENDYLDFLFKKEILTIEECAKQHEPHVPDAMK